jgi:hypothetical protein
MGDKVIAEALLDEAALAEKALPPPDLFVPEKDRMLVLVVNLLIGPTMIDEETRIKVEAEVDGTEIKGNVLRIRVLANP